MNVKNKIIVFLEENIEEHLHDLEEDKLSSTGHKRHSP